MKVLIVRVGAMGDVLHALPAVAALRRARPEWTIDWVVDPRWAPLLVDAEGRGAVVRQVHVARTQLWSGAPLSSVTRRSVLALRDLLREERYDLVVDMQGTIRSAVIARMARGKVTAGYADPREAPAAWLYQRRILRQGAHVVEQGAALLGEATGVPLVATSVELPSERSAEAWAETDAVIKRPMCVLAPGGGWVGKQWPAERYGALAKELRAQGFDVVVNSAHEVDPLAAKVMAASGGAARVVVSGIAGLIALLRRADLFVGGDSGPTHLAAALAVPTIAIFGPTDPERNGPWGPGICRMVRDAASVNSYKRTAEVELGLSKLSVATVMEAVKAVSSE